MQKLSASRSQVECVVEAIIAAKQVYDRTRSDKTFAASDPIVYPDAAFAIIFFSETATKPKWSLSSPRQILRHNPSAFGPSAVAYRTDGAPSDCGYTSASQRTRNPRRAYFTVFTTPNRFQALATRRQRS